MKPTFRIGACLNCKGLGQCFSCLERGKAVRCISFQHFKDYISKLNYRTKEVMKDEMSV